MAAIAKFQTVFAPMSGDEEEIRFEYDFGVDKGAMGALDILEAGEDLIVSSFHTHVLGTCTSSGSATLAVGVTGTTSLFVTATQGAVASLGANAVIIPAPVEGTPNVIALPRLLAKGAKVLQTIGTAALTAGKVQYVIRVRRP